VNLDRVVELTLVGLPTSGPDRLGELNRRLRGLLRAVKGLQNLITARPKVSYQAILFNIIENLPSGSDRLVEIDRRLQELSEALEED
jgi:hypothetical protein